MCRPDEEINPIRQWSHGSRVYHGNHGYGLVTSPCDPGGWVLVSFRTQPAIRCAHDLLTPDLRAMHYADSERPVRKAAAL
jgi:hypothetical protein